MPLKGLGREVRVGEEKGRREGRGGKKREFMVDYFIFFTQKTKFFLEFIRKILLF